MEIQNGLHAFDRHPDGTTIGCFISRAGMWGHEDTLGVMWLSWCYEVSPENHTSGWREQVNVHGNLHEWLKGECLRELAERGVAPEAAPQKAEVAA